MTEKTMRLYTSPYGDQPSFAAYPTTKDAPFLNLVFNPRDKSLAVIGSILKDGHVYEDKLDDNGLQEEISGAKRKELEKRFGRYYPFKRVRLAAQVTNEYLITVREEQIALIESVCENADTYKFLEIIDAVIQEPAKESTILSPDAIAALEGKKEGLKVVQE